MMLYIKIFYEILWYGDAKEEWEAQHEFDSETVEVTELEKIKTYIYVGSIDLTGFNLSFGSDDVAFALRDCKDLPWLSKYLM